MPFYEKQFIIISVDLNCLKEINDSQGHNAGDNALKRLADILVSNSGKNYCPYRIGGNEFIILGKDLEDEKITKFINTLREDLKKVNLMASFGYSLFKSGDNFDEVCQKADAQMYKDKKRYRHR